MKTKMKDKKVKSKSLPDRIKKVRKILLSADNTIGSVHFYKRSGGFRKMAYRLPKCEEKAPEFIRGDESE